MAGDVVFLGLWIVGIIALLYGIDAAFRVLGYDLWDIDNEGGGRGADDDADA